VTNHGMKPLTIPLTGASHHAGEVFKNDQTDDASRFPSTSMTYSQSNNA
jgi:hypothetical protein